MAEVSISLRYTGSTLVRRIIDEYEWSAANDFVADVPVALAADLLTGRESAEWAVAAKPKAAALRQLAEEMGGMLPADIPIAEKEDEVKNDG